MSYIIIGEMYDVAFAYANPHAHISSFHQFLAPFTLLNLNDPIMERFADIRSLLLSPIALFLPAHPEDTR